MHDIDQTFRDHQASVRRYQRAAIGIVVLFWAVVLCIGAWVLTDPQTVGAFFGRVAAGFAGAA